MKNDESGYGNKFEHAVSGSSGEWEKLQERERLLKKAVTSILTTIYDLELAGHFERETLLLVEDLTDYKYDPENDDEARSNDSDQ